MHDKWNRRALLIYKPLTSARTKGGEKSVMYLEEFRLCMHALKFGLKSGAYSTKQKHK